MRESQLVERKESWRDEYPLRICGRTWDDLPCPGVSIKDPDGRTLPRVAMREAVINAVIHRDYADPVPIRISVYDDRIQLWNPGHLPPEWTVERLAGEHASRPHNPGVAYAFFRAGMIEASGRGIGRIKSACAAAGNPPPEWKTEPGGGLRLEFQYSAAYQAADRLIRDPLYRTQSESRRPESQPEWARPESRPTAV